MDTIEKETYSEKVALSGAQMESAMLKLGFLKVEFAITSLQELNEREQGPNKIILIIYTGDKPDEYSKHSHHWICLFGRSLFDSYSKQDDYKLPFQYDIVKTVPKQLQAYDTDVCGEMCLAFVDSARAFIKDDENYVNKEEIGNFFTTRFKLTNDLDKNDKIVLEWYEREAK